MHIYGKISDRNIYIVVGLVVISLLSAFLMSIALKTFHLELPFYVDAPSTFGFFGLWYWLFDVWIWKSKLGKIILCNDCENYAGKYQGKTKSSFNSEQLTDCLLTVRQTYSRISIILESKKSRSKSITACIVEGFGKPQLHYVYKNEPFSHADEDMHSHIGNAYIEFKEDSHSLYMEYFTGRDRTTHGHGTFKRVVKQ